MLGGDQTRRKECFLDQGLILCRWQDLQEFGEDLKFELGVASQVYQVVLHYSHHYLPLFPLKGKLAADFCQYFSIIDIFAVSP